MRVMDYGENERGLKQLLGKLEYIQGTYPPVYRFGSFLIGYDKQGRLKILAVVRDEPVPAKWLGRAWQALTGRPVSQATRQ
jgi:hypothetical protein